MTLLPEFPTTRPACPVCGLGSLTGSMDYNNGELRTACQNPECGASVGMNEGWGDVRVLWRPSTEDPKDAKPEPEGGVPKIPATFQASTLRLIADHFYA